MSTPAQNPFVWVEIYVEDMPRAQQFYEAVFQIEMVPMEAPGEYEDLVMMLFPWSEEEGNISGALCKTNDVEPGTGGTLIYFACDDCSVETSRVESAGGKVLQPKTPMGEHGFWAKIMDTEGNAIGLQSNQ
jgi:uncharacterized protein